MNLENNLQDDLESDFKTSSLSPLLNISLEGAGGIVFEKPLSGKINLTSYLFQK